MDIQIGMPCKYELLCTLIGWGITIFIVFLIVAASFAILRKPASHKPTNAKDKKQNANSSKSNHFPFKRE